MCKSLLICRVLQRPMRASSQASSQASSKSSWGLRKPVGEETQCTGAGRPASQGRLRQAPNVTCLMRWVRPLLHAPYRLGQAPWRHTHTRPQGHVSHVTPGLRDHVASGMPISSSICTARTMDLKDRLCAGRHSQASTPRAAPSSSI